MITNSEKERFEHSGISIVVPTYEEAENISELVERIAAALSALDSSFEIVIVDDFSGDGTDAVVEESQGQGYPVQLIIRRDERDLSSAVIRGFRASAGDILVCMDADLSHPPESLPDLVRPIQDGEADFVIGSRYVEGGSVAEGWGFLRWLNSKLAALFARPLTRVKDPMAGFFAISRTDFENGSQLNPVGYKIGLELIVKCDPDRIREVPIHFAERKRGSSKLSFREQFKYLKHVLMLIWYTYFREE